MIMHAVTRTPATPDDRDLLRDTVVAGLERAATVLESQGLAVPPIEGKLLRPTLAYALVPPDRRGELDDRFWLGALAIQMVHEASLLHDDVLDEAAERRDEPTVFAEHGAGAAVVKGDQYLTGAYRAALWARSPDFLEIFIASVERTVAGEVLQGRAVGERLDLETYFDAILGKSGELFRAAACLGACLLGLDRTRERGQLGLELGALYQQVDDLLDYCPDASTGKEGLKDYRQRKWTWVLELADVDTWDAGDDTILEKVFGLPGSGPSTADRALAYLEVRRDALLRKLDVLVPGDALTASLVGDWIDAARAGVELQATRRRTSASAPWRPPARSSAEADVRAAVVRLDDPESWRRCFRSHARTFSFASCLFPAEERRRVEALYAYCRFTDDLVDDPAEPASTETLAERLTVWRELSREAYDGRDTGVPLLSSVMGDASAAGVDWLYPEALLDGVEMDLRPRSYASWGDLSRYCFCVAGAVGGWMTHLFGIHDPDTLGRAHALGHAMQLTNVLRDVGEDLSNGRVYLPASLLEEHRLTVTDLRSWLDSPDPLPTRYADAMRTLVAVADERYEWAEPGIADLPAFFRRPVAVAAAAYRGIHDEVRRGGYDTLRKRASTSFVTKVRLGSVGLLRARPERSEPGAEELAT